jgi:cytoskeletal protein RodZ
MTLEQFAEGLKQLRIERQLSLLDISTETRINIKFLAAIESGQFHMLPQTYIRAFLREYGLMVGARPEDLLRQYNEIAMSSPQPASLQKEPSLSTRLPGADPSWGVVPQQTWFFIAGLAIVIIVLASWFAVTSQPAQHSSKTPEIPFEKIVQENEAAAISQNPVQQPQIIVPPKIDSLTLEMTTTDSVWINLLIDNKKSEEHLVGPHRKYSWTAKERFAVTMGNAGGATFQLNGKELGMLGRRGAVLRNMILTEASLHGQ